MLWNRHLACSDISHGQDARATINYLINKLSCVVEQASCLFIYLPRARCPCHS